jgi:hypothetical protein
MHAYEMSYKYHGSNKKKIRVGENGVLNQSKHQNSTIQVTRFFF